MSYLISGKNAPPQTSYKQREKSGTKKKNSNRVVRRTTKRERVSFQMGERVLFNSANGSTAAARLTQRESEIAGLVLQGMGNKIIARQLGLQVGTVKIHLHHIYRKLGVPNRRVFLFNNLNTFAKLAAE